jgi:mono/diheme cytochrome c family protein
LPHAQEDEAWFEKGKELYEDQCVTCHGDSGEGVDGAYDGPLEGDLSLRRLKDYIVKTMPEDDA